jgi:hypothetical protein
LEQGRPTPWVDGFIVFHFGHSTTTTLSHFCITKLSGLATTFSNIKYNRHCEKKWDEMTKNEDEDRARIKDLKSETNKLAKTINNLIVLPISSQNMQSPLPNFTLPTTPTPNYICILPSNIIPQPKYNHHKQ